MTGAFIIRITDDCVKFFTHIPQKHIPQKTYITKNLSDFVTYIGDLCYYCKVNDIEESLRHLIQLLTCGYVDGGIFTI